MLPVGWPGNAEAGGVDGFGPGQEIVEQRFESREVGAGVALLADDADRARFLPGEREQRLGAAEVAAEEHRAQTATCAAMWGCGS